MSDELVCNLRAASEVDVSVAMENTEFYFDARPAALLKFFNRMLDVLGAPDHDGDICTTDDG